MILGMSESHFSGKSALQMLVMVDASCALRIWLGGEERRKGRGRREEGENEGKVERKREKGERRRRDGGGSMDQASTILSSVTLGRRQALRSRKGTSSGRKGSEGGGGVHTGWWEEHGSRPQQCCP